LQAKLTGEKLKGEVTAEKKRFLAYTHRGKYTLMEHEYMKVHTCGPIVKSTYKKVFFSAVTSAFQLFTCKLCLQFSGLRMRNFT